MGVSSGYLLVGAADPRLTDTCVYMLWACAQTAGGAAEGAAGCVPQRAAEGAQCGAVLSVQSLLGALRSYRQDRHRHWR